MANAAQGQRSESLPFKPLPYRPPDMSLRYRADGSVLMWSNIEPAPAWQSIAHLFRARCREFSETAFIRQRTPGHGPWREVSYAGAGRAAEGIAQWLIDKGIGAEDSVLILSGNSIEHALLTLGCYLARVPAAPVSAAFSLVSEDHAKLRHVAALLRPKLVYAQEEQMFSRAFATLRGIDPSTIFLSEKGGELSLPFSDLAAHPPTEAVAGSADRAGADTVAKYLFTSGSTGLPKCVPQTHGMMVHSLAGMEGLLLDEERGLKPTVSLEWMPWSHISAGNIMFNTSLQDGGTLYIDEGKPIPGLFETTIKNLYEVSPTVFGSAPIAFAMLASAMEEDDRLRRSFFKNLRYMGYGGAPLSSDLSARLQALAVAETGQRIPITTMFGSTETQGVTLVHWATERVGMVGLPLPGITVKLVPGDHKLELRVKGPTVMEGYIGAPEQTDEAFDEEGFYKLGDAVRFLDPASPASGLIFDGRITEEFKLDSGTWVSVGSLRPDIVATCSPYVQDVVVAGSGKPYIGILVWPTQAVASGIEQPGEESDTLRVAARLIGSRLGEFNVIAGGSSRRVRRFMLVREPLSLDAGEITDKGYVNQRAVLDRRSALVARLFADTPDPDVVDLDALAKCEAQSATPTNAPSSIGD